MKNLINFVIFGLLVIAVAFLRTKLESESEKSLELAKRLSALEETSTKLEKRLEITDKRLHIVTVEGEAYSSLFDASQTKIEQSFSKLSDDLKIAKMLADAQYRVLTKESEKLRKEAAQDRKMLERTVATLLETDEDVKGIKRGQVLQNSSFRLSLLNIEERLTTAESKLKYR